MTDMVFQLLVVFMLGLGVASGILAVDPGRTAATGRQEALRGGHVNITVQETAAGFLSRVTTVPPSLGAQIGFAASGKVMTEDELMVMLYDLRRELESKRGTQAVPINTDFRVTYAVGDETPFGKGLAAYGGFRQRVIELGLVPVVYVETLSENGGGR